MDENKAKELCEWLLRLLKIPANVQTSASEGFVHLDIETEEAGLLIGRGGQTLDALETVLNVIYLRKNPDDGLRISLDVSSFRKKREEQLTSAARELAQKVKDEGGEEKMPNLTARERRVVHLALSTDGDILTESQGEGEERTLIIKKKEA